jgi:DNA repair protein RadC
MKNYRLPRYRVKLVKDGSVLTSIRHVEAQADAFRIFHPVLSDLPHEEMWVLLLSSGNEVRGLVRVAQGRHNRLAITPLEVLRPVVASGCVAFILAHNHPSGNPQPSPEDVAMTASIAESADAIGCKLLDHLVVVATGYQAIRVRGIE